MKTLSTLDSNTYDNSNMKYLIFFGNYLILLFGYRQNNYSGTIRSSDDGWKIEIIFNICFEINWSNKSLTSLPKLIIDIIEKWICYYFSTLSCDLLFIWT